MKTSRLLSQLKHQTVGGHFQSNEQLLGIDSSSSLHELCQSKYLSCIEVTSQWRYSSGEVDNTLRKEVFYRKPLLTPEGKLDKDRLAVEILTHR